MNTIYPHPPETAEECRVSISAVRSTAQHIFAEFMLRSALQQYAKDNSGLLRSRWNPHECLEPRNDRLRQLRIRGKVRRCVPGFPYVFICGQTLFPYYPTRRSGCHGPNSSSRIREASTRQATAPLTVNSEHAIGMKERKSFGGLLCRRQCLVPTWRGWLALLVAAAAGAFVGVRTVQPFLAVNAPVSGGLLVVEGWMPDFAMKEAIAEFGRNRYSSLFVTGGALRFGAPLSEYRTYAELGAATIAKLGLGTNVVQPVPAPLVLQDRTFASAVALKHWLRGH